MSAFRTRGDFFSDDRGRVPDDHMQQAVGAEKDAADGFSAAVEELVTLVSSGQRTPSEAADLLGKAAEARGDWENAYNRLESMRSSAAESS